MRRKIRVLLRAEKKSIQLRQCLRRRLLRKLVPVTRIALERRRLIEDGGLVADEFYRRVTFVTLHVGVAAGQRHLGALVVVKRRRHPPLRIVTGLAGSLARVIFELTAVGFHVARLASRRRALELNFL